MCSACDLTGVCWRLHWQFDVLTMIRPRRGSMRRMLVRDMSVRGLLADDDSSMGIDSLEESAQAVMQSI